MGEKKPAGNFELNASQRDENRRPRTPWASDYLPTDGDDIVHVTMDEALGINPENPIPLRAYWIFREVLLGAKTVEDLRDRGIPDPLELPSIWAPRHSSFYR